MPEFISNTIQLHIAAKTENSYKFLVLKRSDNIIIYPGLWQVITGTMEANEPALNTALRELKEETGLKPIKFWTVPYVSVFYVPSKDLIHASPVFAALVDINQKIKLSKEHQDYLWLGYDDCINKLELPSHKEGTKIFNDFILNGTTFDEIKL